MPRAMVLELVIPLVAVAVVLTFAAGAVRAWRVRRRAAADEMSVTLSVLPTRTAVVVVDVDGDVVSPGLTRLVQHAVREAFVFSAVDVVEVRRRDGGVVERRHRPVRTGVGARTF